MRFFSKKERRKGGNNKRKKKTRYHGIVWAPFKRTSVSSSRAGGTIAEFAITFAGLNYRPRVACSFSYAASFPRCPEEPSSAEYSSSGKQFRIDSPESSTQPKECGERYPESAPSRCAIRARINCFNPERFPRRIKIEKNLRE